MKPHLKGHFVEMLEGVAKLLEFWIMATPTGAERDKLTEVNIHMYAAVNAMKEVPTDGSDEQGQKETPQ